MILRPTITWEEADPASLYTVMIEDNDINGNGVPRFFHWLVVNVPGDVLAAGAEIYDYIPSFSFFLDEDGTLIVSFKFNLNIISG